MRDEVRRFIRIAPSLTSQEVGAVRAALNALESLGPSNSPVLVNTNSDEHFVLTAIADFMQGKGVDMTGREQLARGRAYAGFRAKVPGIIAYIKQCGDRNSQRLLLNMGLELLYEDLERIGLAITSRSIMSHAHRISGVLNRAFPGYAQSGLLSLVFRKETPRVRTKQSHVPVPPRERR